MLKKESKIRVLENFYAIDYVFFGKPVTEIKSCCPLVKEEYLTVKGALMSVFIEMLKMVDHQPKPLKEFVDSAALNSFAKKSAKVCREAARKIIAMPQSRKNIKESVSQFLSENKKANVSKVIEQKITEKAFSIAVDALLIGRTVNESKSYKKLNEWEGRILEDSYKILRDSLVEAAYQILDGATDEPAKKKVSEGFWGDIKGSLEKEREIKNSNMSPEQKKKAWANHLVYLCKRDAERKNWSKEKLASCISAAKKQ